MLLHIHSFLKSHIMVDIYINSWWHSIQHKNLTDDLLIKIQTCCRLGSLGWRSYYEMQAAYTTQHGCLQIDCDGYKYAWYGWCCRHQQDQGVYRSLFEKKRLKRVYYCGTYCHTLGLVWQCVRERIWWIFTETYW